MYELIAQIYDEFTTDIDRQTMLDFIVNNLNKRTCSNGDVLDLCCGTGELSYGLVENGFSVIGADASADMLTLAKQKFSSDNKILFIFQDMRELDLYGSIGGCICTLDSFNHLESIEDFTKVIKRLSIFIESGGIFIFDLNTLFKHKYILGDNLFFRENENNLLIWQSEFYKNGKVDLYFDLFKKTKNNLYERFSDNFSEIAFDLKKVKKYLKKIIFQKLKFTADMTVQN